MDFVHPFPEWVAKGFSFISGLEVDYCWLEIARACFAVCKPSACTVLPTAVP